MGLTSDDYAATAGLLAKRLWKVIESGSMNPPLGVEVTGFDDDLVMHALIAQDGTLRDLSVYPEQGLV